MKIFTDASTRNKISGLAYVAVNGKDKEIYKTGVVIDQSDNNTAELQAILYAIDDCQDLLQENEKITILTDSTYAVGAIRNNIYRENEEPLVRKIQDIMSGYDVSLYWLKGHQRYTTNILAHYNKRADKMSKVVRKTYEKEQEKLKKEKIKQAISKKALRDKIFDL